MHVDEEIVRAGGQLEDGFWRVVRELDFGWVRVF